MLRNCVSRDGSTWFQAGPDEAREVHVLEILEFGELQHEAAGERGGPDRLLRHHVAAVVDGVGKPLPRPVLAAEAVQRVHTLPRPAAESQHI